MGILLARLTVLYYFEYGLIHDKGPELVVMSQGLAEECKRGRNKLDRKKHFLNSYVLI